MQFNKKILIDSTIGLIMGGGLVFLVYEVIDKQTLLKFFPTESALSNTIFFSSVVLAPFVAIALHELGHLFAGLLQNFKTELYVVGFLGIKRENNKLRVYFNTNVQYFGGVAATSPTKLLEETDLINKYKLILISGPIASLVVAFAAIGYFLFNNSLFNPFFGILGVASFGIFLATTLPEKTGIFFTDRKRFQRLNDKGEIGKTELAFLQIVNQTLLENTCKNIAIDKLALLKKDADNIIQFWGHYFEYQYFKDNNMADAALETKANLLSYKSYLPNAFWKTLAIE